MCGGTRPAALSPLHEYCKTLSQTNKQTCARMWKHTHIYSVTVAVFGDGGKKGGKERKGDLVTRAFILTLNQVSVGLGISNRATAHPTGADTQLCVCACGKKMTHMGLMGLHMYDK